MAEGKAIEAGSDKSTRPLILEPQSPFPESLGLLQFDHRETVFYKLLQFAPWSPAESSRRFPPPSIPS
jgi:hypothetical protein